MPKYCQYSQFELPVLSVFCSLYISYSDSTGSIWEHLVLPVWSSTDGRNTGNIERRSTTSAGSIRSIELRNTRSKGNFQRKEPLWVLAVPLAFQPQKYFTLLEHPCDFSLPLACYPKPNPKPLVTLVSIPSTAFSLRFPQVTTCPRCDELQSISSRFTLMLIYFHYCSICHLW